MSRNVSGLDEIYATFASLPVSAREELARRLTTIASQVANEQRSVVPHKTGHLASTITSQENSERLKATAGLINLTKSSNFYGVFAEYGRKAGSKVVERRRRVGGKLRLKNRRKRLEDIESRYVMHWHARAGKPFIHIDNLADPIIDNGLAGFWESVLSKLA